MSTYHSREASKFQDNKERAVWHNQALSSLRQKRDNLSKGIPEWEDLREIGNEIKLHTITHLDKYLEQFADNAEKNGVIVHWAKDAKHHNEIVLDILKNKNAKRLIKSKSMLTEECHLMPFLEERGIEVIESDLGERILQLDKLAPSHIVVPAVHLNRKEVGKIFEREMGTEKDNSDPTYLTWQARKSLRKEFITADASMTGVNFGIAETGEFVVCTNEGNADMGTALQDLHIASMGIEKLIPTVESLAVFTRLLARSATGQPVTTYTSQYKKPRKGGELHLILVDNGRSDWIGNEDHIQSLKCIRCGACMNTCPVYRRSGGYSYSYFIPGPIGINLGMLRDPKEYSGNVSACSLCYSCNNVCPVKIDLADQIYKWRQDLEPLGKASFTKKMASNAMGFMFARPKLYNFMLKFGWLAKYMPTSIIPLAKDWTKGRSLPDLSKESFTSMWKKGKLK